MTAGNAKYTPVPWEWVIHDHSMASLVRGDNPGMGDPLVLTVAPCPACAERASPKEWKWGRCMTPNEQDARLIAAAPDLVEALKEYVRDFGDNEDSDSQRMAAKARAVLSKAGV